MQGVPFNGVSGTEYEKRSKGKVVRVKATILMNERFSDVHRNLFIRDNIFSLTQ